jgi:diguanylate cyclase (GGDEF)-like protein
MELNLLTLTIVLMCMQVALTCVHLMMRRAHPHEQALVAWAWANMIMAVACAMLAAHKQLPHFLSFAMSGWLIVLAHAALVAGLRIFLKQRLQLWPVALGLLAILAMANMFFYFAVPNGAVRVILNALASAAFMGMAIWHIKRTDERLVVLRPLMIAFAAHGLLLLLRIFFTSLMPGKNMFAIPEQQVVTWAILETLISFLFINICFVIMVGERLQHRLNKMADLDALTGIANRRAFLREGEVKLGQCQANSANCAVLLIDIDYFKQINDTHGHQAGDAVLAQLGDILRTQLRPRDLAARIGGEEFAVLLPDAEEPQAEAIAERLRTQFSAQSAPRATLSIGWAGALDDETLAGAMARADKALYQAKRLGRNRVAAARPVLEFAPEPPDPLFQIA